MERYAPTTVNGVEESVKVVVDAIKNAGPFDGVISFSQGSIFFRHLMRIL